MKIIRDKTRNTNSNGVLDASPTIIQSILLFLVVLAITSTTITDACTNILVTPGASNDGSSMIAYNADSPTLYGVVYHYPASNNNNTSSSSNSSSNTASNTTSKMTTKRTIYDWDSGRYMGDIDIDPNRPTYNVVGNGNDQGLLIGETTFGGLGLLAWNQTNAIMDYGSLIYMTLQYTKTAVEAIHFMVDLMDTYGYASGGESFSLADYTTGDVWMMEIISRGNTYRNNDDDHHNTNNTTMGAVWVAQRIPDSAVAAHANQARIQTFPRNDPDNVLYAPDVVDVAIHYGLYPRDADPLLFSFADTYDPITFIEARQGEARVWSIFSYIADTTGTFQNQYESYAMGINLTNRMPLYVIPYRKLSFIDIVSMMASHYENTKLDSSVDVGSGVFASPYRPRPLTWEYPKSSTGSLYHNERNIATAKTGWNFIGQIRHSMPRIISTILWFACDDSSTSPRTPIYTTSTTISPAYFGYGPQQDGYLSPLLTLDMNKAFWIQNMVSNLAYSRWMDIYPILRNTIENLQAILYHNVTLIDKEALQIYNGGNNTDATIQYVTDFSVVTANRVQELWLQLYGELFVQFRDFYTIVPDINDPLCGCSAQEPGFSDVMKQRIVTETGDHYKVIDSNSNVPTSVDRIKISGENGKLFRSTNDFTKTIERN